MYSYDADDAAASHPPSASVPVQAPLTEPVPISSTSPGYGEEPEMTYDHTSFENEASVLERTAEDNGVDKHDADGDDMDMSSAPFGGTMKEDG